MNDDTEKQSHELALQSTGGGDMLLDRARFEQGYKIARLFSSSQLVPQHLQGKPEDCFIALHMANRLREDPLMVMQNIVIVHGTAGWKATWLIGRANRSGVFRGRIRFAPQGSGDSLSVTASAVLADTGEEVKATADMKMAKAEGWTKNAKYQSMPEQMLSYRAASFLIRLYCPEATLGYQSAEEVEDMVAAGQIKNVTPGRHTPTGGATHALRNLGNGDEGGDQSGGEEPKLPERDADNLPWDERIHSQPPKINQSDGRWRRGVQDDEYRRVAEELRSIDADVTVSSEPEGGRESGDPGNGEPATGPDPNDPVTQAVERMEGAENQDRLDEIADEALNGTDIDKSQRERLTRAHKRNSERLAAAGA